MKQEDKSSLIALPVVIIIGVLAAFAGSQANADILGIPVFAVAVGISFLFQWLAFIPAYVLQTEKFFDLAGSITFISVITLSFVFSPAVDGRSILLWAIVMIWAIRLGTFLFFRIKKTGKDQRFDDIKPSFSRFLTVWTMQGLWVVLTVSSALVGVATVNRKELGIFALVGFILWVFGFTFEIVADYQKSRFNSEPRNNNTFIQKGLWSLSRHPNYFGEIILWTGVAIIALPVLRGWQWVTLISPVFVAVLLKYVSGVPLLEKKADKKWGGQEDYEAYKKRTPVLIPRFRFLKKTY